MGLLQVLEEMNDGGSDPVAAFSHAAAAVLTRRVPIIFSSGSRRIALAIRLDSACKWLQSSLIMPSLPFRLIAVFAFLAMAGAADAQWFKRSSPTPQARYGQPMQVRPGQPMQLQPQRPASQLIQRQPPLKINQKVLNQCTPDNVHVIVSIPKQRALLMLDEQVAADSPISSGKKGHSTPTGKFTILEKDPNHHSTIYGDFCDSQGQVIRPASAPTSTPHRVERISSALK